MPLPGRLAGGRLGRGNRSRSGGLSSKDRGVLLVGPNYLNSAFTTTNANGTRRNAQGLIEAVPANTPRFDYDVNGNLLGLLVEESRTNYALNSDAPANQTIDLTSAGTGDYTLSVVGSGSCAVAAGTATGTGFGSATEGSPVTFNLSAAGTITLTITGTLDYFQVEKGSFATSMIITAGSAVTRTADVIVCTDLGRIGFNAAEGAVYADVRRGAASGTQSLVDARQATSNTNQTQLYLANETLSASVRSGGVQSALLSSGEITTNTLGKAVLGYADNDFAFVLDGGAPATDATGDVPVGLSNFWIGSSAGVTDYFGGHIKTLRLYPTRLPNAQLQSMTV